MKQDLTIVERNIQFATNAFLSVQREADKKFTHEFRWMNRGFLSTVKVEVWELEEHAVVLFTDTGVGTSITNAAEQVIEEVYIKHLSKYKKENCLFIETYDKKKEGLDIIIPQWVGNAVVDVDWRHMGKIVN